MKNINFGKLLASTLGVVLASAASVANAGIVQSRLNVPFYWQDNGCWCGIATAESMIEWHRGEAGNPWNYYPNRQTNLWKLHKNYVGHTDQATDKHPCGKLDGVSIKEMHKILDKGLGSHYRFRDVVHTVRNNSSESFHNGVINQIENKRNPVMVMGNTRYKNTDPMYGTHWFTIVGVKYDNNDSFDPDKHGYYVYDTTYRSPYTRHINSIYKGKFVSHRNFMDILAYKGSDEDTENGRVNSFFLD